MIPIHVNEDLNLPNGYSEYEIDSIRDLDLTFTASQDCEVYIRIVKAGRIRIRTFASENIHVKYLFWNDAKDLIDIDESHDVSQGTEFHVAYCETGLGPVNRNCYVALRGEGARGRVSSAAVVASNKKFTINVVNFSRRTYGDMDNYSIVLPGGNYYMNAIGKIIKGASMSENHQVSRSLSFSGKQQCHIIPTLLIDENDVQASHAMSVGSIDEEQLYYLMSRGLTRKECTRLISTGYLMPIADTINNQELQEKLHQKLEEELEQIC